MGIQWRAQISDQPKTLSHLSPEYPRPKEVSGFALQEHTEILGHFQDLKFLWGST